MAMAVALLGSCSKKEEARGKEADVIEPRVDVAQSTVQPQPQPSEAGVRDDGSVVSAVDWFTGSFEEALVHARASGKLVLVHVGAYWCPPCHRLEEEVFTLPRIGAFLGEGYVAVHVDAEKGEGPELAERYKVQAYPTLLVLEPSGVEKDRIVDFIEGDELVSKLERIAAGGNVLAELEAAIEDDPDDLEARYRLAHAYALAARRDAALKHHAVIEVGDPTDEMGLHSQILYDRALFFTYKIDGDRAAAIAELEQLQARFPDSKAAVRAYRHIGRLLHEGGRSAEAIASLDRMLATHPDDPALAASYGWFSFRERCEPARGLEIVERTLEGHPDDPELHYLRAELQHLVGNDVLAREAIEQASKLEPDSAFYRRQVRRFTALTGQAG
jgi:thioredoxin-like negative regulator of GroEL